MTLQGKGFYTHLLPACEAGDPLEITRAALDAGLSHVLVKIADGTQPFGLDETGQDLSLPLIQALHAAGIAVWGWHAVYGDDPTGEAALAIIRVQELALDGYVLSAGAAYEQADKAQAARAFMTALRADWDVPIALSSYRFPNFHPELPWAAFLEKCDAVMPQVYWEAAHNAGSQLRECLRQYKALPNARPCIPTGAAYGRPGGWAPTLEDLADFINTAKELDVEGLNFYSWDTCRSDLSPLWDLIANFAWPAQPQTSAPILEPIPAAAQPLPPATPLPTATSSQPAAGAEAGMEYFHPPAAGAEAGVEYFFPPAGGGQLVTPDSRAEAIKSHLSSMPNQPDTFVTRYLTALQCRQAGKVSALYAEDAVHVRGDKVLNGAPIIRSGYSAFFYGLPAGAIFELLGVEVSGDVRYLAWKAGALTAYESILLREGKIVLEYTYIE
ncbi:MAG: hypothetical protein QMD04_11410 [Anaerolineales bacterium]|nr:hypothetical protein [Anaerolineales bacterium]